MRSRPLAAALAGLALAAPAAIAAPEAPVTRVSDTGGRADVLARADGSALAVWESGASVRFCRIAAGAGTCTAGTERTLAPDAAVGTTTSRPFLFDLSGNRIVVVRGECCPQHTYRWISSDNGATFPAGVDFASVVPLDQGAAVGPGDAISLLGDPARYQLATTAGAGKTAAEAALDASPGLTGAHAVSVDPLSGRPFAAWSSATDTFFSGATTSSPNSASNWAARGTITGATGVRLAGAVAAWVRGGRHEIARWSAGVLSAPVALAHAPDDAGESALATDPAGGVHLVYSPPGSGALCYAYGAAGETPGSPVLLGRDSAGASALRVSATAAATGRVVFTAGGGVDVVSLSATSMRPNVCGLAPTGVLLSRVAGRSAFSAAFDPAGQDTTWHLEYGLGPEYGSSGPETAVAGSAGPVVASAPLTGLTPGAAYHVRLVATNATGTTASPDVVFRTPPTAVRVRLAQVIRFGPRCVNRRLRLELTSRPGARPVLAELRVRSRKPLRLGPKRLAAGEVTLTGLPRRRVAVRVTVRLADGRVLRRAATFRKCA
ncbi:MAG: fibronectin type III domain-containing protein [Solirubrobacteraceae bacterium]